MTGGWLSRLSFAWRNVSRHRARSAATLAAISIGVAGLILAGGFVQDIFVQLGEAIIHSQAGHIQVTRQGFREGYIRQPDAYLIDYPETLRQELAAVAGVDHVVERLSFAGVLNNGRRDLGIVGEGVEPGGEASIGTYLRFVEGRALKDADADGIVVGNGVAKSLGLKVGDRVTLVMTLSQGAVNTLDFELVGVFQSFSKEFDARAVRIPLEAARSLMDNHAAHVMVVTLQETGMTDDVAAAYRASLGQRGFAVDIWRNLSDFYEKTRDLYDRQFGVLRLIILLMVLLSVVNSVNMTVFERTREFGTVLALGDRPVDVFRTVVLESAILGFMGALLGIAAGCGLAWVISAIGIPMPPPPNSDLGYTATIRLVPVDVVIAGLIGFVATCLAAVRPAWRASRLSVVEALRHGI